MKLRVWLSIIAILALLAAACGGDDDDGAEASTATTEEAPTEAADPTAGDDGASGGEEEGEETDGGEEVALTASWRGVTEDTITLGFSMLDFDILKELNLSPAGWGDQQLIYQTFIDNINANGGIHGRMIEPVYRFYSPLGTTEAEAACLELTEDTATFAVVGGFLGPAEDANTCVVGIQNTILIGGRQSIERLAVAEAPWFETGANRTRRLEIFLTLLESEGMLAGAKVALIGGINAEDDYQQARELLPEFGVEPVVEILNEAPDGDIPAQDAIWASLSERVIASGADTALIVGSTSGNIRGLGNNGIDIAIWNVDNDGLNNLGESVDPAWADGVITLGSLGDLEAWDDETVAECRRIFDEANPDVEYTGPAETEEGEEQWFNPIMAYCRWLGAFVLIATEAGPDLTHDSFSEAATRLDEFPLPGQPFNSYTDKPDANDSFRLSVYDASLGARGEIVPMTAIIDVTP